MDQAHLFCQEGSSDKVYQTEIVSVADGFMVNFAYGRRGSTMQTGTKTVKPVPYARAKSIFDKLVESKLSKGYEYADKPITVFANAGGDHRAQSGYKPQLLNPVEEVDLDAYFADPAYMMQEKMDGERRLVKMSGGDVVGINRKGQVIPLNEAIAAELRALPDCVLDGEEVGDRLWAFDCIEFEGEDLREKPAEDRYSTTQELVGICGANIQMVKAFATEAGKRKEFARIKAALGEGVVFKRRQAPYRAGRPASLGDQVKFKFTATATVEVHSVGWDGKLSVGIAVRDLSGGPRRIGNVKVPTKYKMPAAGDLVEVRYLYCFPGGSLFQPVYLGPRPDKTTADTYDALKFKQPNDEDEEAF
jgi:bifunctional non-homologous end joining protein LigD